MKNMNQLFDPRGVERPGDLCHHCGEEPREPNSELCFDCRTTGNKYDQERSAEQ